MWLPATSPGRSLETAREEGDLELDLTLGSEALDQAVDDCLSVWGEARLAERLWSADPTVWAEPPYPPELEDRLGWLELPAAAPELAWELAPFGEEVRRDDLRHVVVLGMGGSSLAPEVFARVLPGGPGTPELRVLDSTHPEAVAGLRASVDPARSLFLVASKSGTTVETLSFFHYFWREVAELVGAGGAGGRFAAITDPGTPLAELAGARGFRRAFLAPPDVGGRYSALSVFGLVPAAAEGLDVARLAEEAARAGRGALRAEAVENPALRLAAALAMAAAAGGGTGERAGEASRDKVTFLASPALASLPGWIEQLVAESLGKEGRGLVPVVDEPVLEPGEYGEDRFFVFLELDGEGLGGAPGGGPGGGPGSGLASVLADAGHPVARIRLRDRAQVGACMLFWEVAVAAAGPALGVHPFDQPDVELAKRRAREAMAGGGAGGAVEEVSTQEAQRLHEALGRWRRNAAPGRYAAIQAFLPPDPGVARSVRDFRRVLARRLGVATTAGYGPRFLHSTGQLHKGGPDSGLFLQLVDAPERDVPVPETDHGFGELIRAQAVGDYRALAERGRTVLRVLLRPTRREGLARLREALETVC
ncbi:MAG: hypothetical protein ACLF0P_02430 [Thermoanaerobaculia bacterium]